MTVCVPISTCGLAHGALLLGATARVTVPLPVPELPEVTAMAEFSGVVFHGQCAGAVTAGETARTDEQKGEEGIPAQAIQAIDQELMEAVQAGIGDATGTGGPQGKRHSTRDGIIGVKLITRG